MNRNNNKINSNNNKGYDCGSTIVGHHTPNCEMGGKNDVMDLPAILGSQWWIGEMPESAGDLRHAELTRDEITDLKHAD